MKKVLFGSFVFFAPAFAFAEAGINNGGTGIATGGLVSTVQGFTTVLNYAIPFFLALAVIAFIIGVIKYLFAQGGDDKAKAREFLLWGVISITVILAVFGIARLLIGVFNLNPAGLQSDQVPTVTVNPTIQ